MIYRYFDLLVLHRGSLVNVGQEKKHASKKKTRIVLIEYNEVNVQRD